MQKEHHYFLNYAASIASNIDPHAVSPNPRVGCVIVQNDKIVAKGIHENFGGKHAEVNAIDALYPLPNGDREGALQNCEIYITLEPCDDFNGKKTPSCTNLLIKNKPKKIIIGSLDPQFKGKNIEKLKKTGINVELQENKKCQSLNPFFQKYITTKMPYLTLKMAQSLDGRINPSPSLMDHKLGLKFSKGVSKYITNETSRQKVHEMRAQHSAILTTVQTILADDPLLDVRLSPPSFAKRELERNLDANEKENNPPTPFIKWAISNPQLIILGGKNKVPKTAKIFTITNRKIHWFDTHDLASVIKECGELSIDSIITECGATVATELIKHNLVDEISLFIAPVIFGEGRNTFIDPIPLAPLVRGVSRREVGFKGDGRGFSDFKLTEVQNLDGDVYVNYQLRKQ